MKIRMGFVSNSSSSSFLMVGAKVRLQDLVKVLGISLSEDDEDDWMMDLDDDLDEQLSSKLTDLFHHILRYEEDGITDDSEILIGSIVSETYNDSDEEITIPEIQDAVNSVTKKLQELNIEADVKIRLVGVQQ